MANTQRRLLALDEAEPRALHSTTQARQGVRTLSASASQPGTRQVAATSANQPATSTAPVTAQPTLSNVQENETVSGQLRQLLDSGSPLLEQSRNRAVTYAAGRGLQNSTLAAQAGESAFIDAAAPIAAADATTFSNRALVNVDAQNRFGLNEQTGNINSRLQREQGDISSRLQGEQGDINSRLQSEQGEIRSGELRLSAELEGQLSQQQFQQQQSLLLTDFAQRMNLSSQDSALQIERMNVQHRQTLEQIEANASAQTRTDGATYSRQLGGSYLTAVSNRQAQASAEIQQIYSTQGLSSSQQQAAVANAYARMQSDMTALAAFYSSAPGWDDSWNVTPGGPQHPIMAQPHPIPAQTPVVENPTERAQRIIDTLLGRRR